MSCPRCGKECYEYMCGSSVDGICTNSDKIKIETDLEKLYRIVTEQLDKTNNQIESATLRWVLDRIDELN